MLIGRTDYLLHNEHGDCVTLEMKIIQIYWVFRIRNNMSKSAMNRKFIEKFIENLFLINQFVNA